MTRTASAALPLVFALRGDVRAPPGGAPEALVSVVDIALGRGEIRAVWGARYLSLHHRVEVDGAAVRVAPQPVFGAIVAAAQLREGWLFVTDDGVLARSDTFLGPLSRVGDLGARALAQTATRGRLALTTLDGELHVTDGRAVVAADTARIRARSAAFADALHGAAALQGGALAVTRDGGSTWREVPLDGAPALDVRYDAPSLRVLTIRGWSTLDAEGRASPPDHAFSPPQPPLVSPLHQRAIESALRARARAFGRPGSSVVTPRRSMRSWVHDAVWWWPGESSSTCPLVEAQGRWGAGRGAWRLRARAGVVPCEFSVVHAGTEVERPVTVASPGGSAALRIASTPRWTRDGLLAAVGCSGACGPDDARWLLLGAPEAPLSAQPLAAGTLDVVFDDRRRGVAVGRDLRSLSRTLDGGRTWEPLPVPIDGPVDGRFYRPERSRCDREGCVVSGLLSLRGWGRARAEGSRWISLVPARGEAGDDAAPRGPSLPWRPPMRVRCADVGAPSPSPLGPPPADALDGAWSSGEVSVLRRPRARGQEATLLRWVGDDVPEGRAPLSATLEREVASLQVIGAGVRGPLLGLERWLIPAWQGARATPLALDDIMREGTLATDGSHLALPADDGGVVVLLATTTAGIASVTVAAHVTSAGTLGAARLLPGVDAAGLGRVGGRDVVAEPRGGRLYAAPLTEGPWEDLGPLPPRVPVCGDVPRDAARVTWPCDRAPFLRVEGVLRWDASVEVAHTRGGACVLGLVARGEWLFDDVQVRFRTARLRARGGRLVGYRDIGGERSPLRCEVLP